jgi:hypothetical protein
MQSENIADVHTMATEWARSVKEYRQPRLTCFGSVKLLTASGSGLLVEGIELVSCDLLSAQRSCL